MLREYKHRHAIVRGKKWDKIILCEICVGPTGHISDKTSMTQHVKTDIGLGRHGESTGRINRSGKRRERQVSHMKHLRVVEWVAMIKFLFGMCHY